MGVTENPSNAAKGRVYGRRKGRPLRVRKTQLMEEFFPRVRIDHRIGEKLTLDNIFKNRRSSRVWMEIGFGGGEHLAEQAKLHPDISFIGCEPFVNGVASLMDHLEASGVTNVRVYNDDARHILDALPEACLDRCYILFADPWPKKKHAERRFVGPENLPRLARVLKPGGVLRLASDHPTLIAWMQEQIPLFIAQNKSFSCHDYGAAAPMDWIKTRYQEKAAVAGRVPIFIDLKRI